MADWSMKSQGSDYWMWVNPDTVADLEHAVSVVAYYRITGQPASVVPQLVTYEGRRHMYVNVPQAVLPNGVEVGLALEITMDDARVVRYPVSGYLSLMVYR